VLEAMAAGVPLVTTRVGQASDLVRHGGNGWLAEVEDVNALVASVEAVREGEHEDVLRAGRETAEANSYESLRPRWRELFRGFVAAAEK
jgi:glycosyltransferase involved in cell wall biosynthesis